MSTEGIITSGIGAGANEFPLWLLTDGLYVGAAALAMAHRVARVFALMEPRLARRLRVYGIGFEQLGPAVEHHGQRAPYGLEARHFEATLSAELRALLHTIQRSLRARHAG